MLGFVKGSESQTLLLLMLRSPSRGPITPDPWLQLLQLITLKSVSFLWSLDLHIWLPTSLLGCLKGTANLAYSKLNHDLPSQIVIIKSRPQGPFPGSHTLGGLTYHTQHLLNDTQALGTQPSVLAQHNLKLRTSALIINTVWAPGKGFCNLLSCILETKDDYNKFCEFRLCLSLSVSEGPTLSVCREDLSGGST